MPAITNGEEIAQAYAIFAQTVSEGGVLVQRMVGYKGASHTADLLWHEQLQLWVLLEPDFSPTRYWCAFGIDDPYPAHMLSITCEINPPREGIYRRCAGLFVRDDSGAVFLAHSGKVGGGRAGIGKTAFLNYWGHQGVQSVHFPDDEDRDYIMLGQIDDPGLLPQLANFVHAVAAFKEEAVGAD